ncbi:prepilin peptidase [Patescibacteria group bacterium]|nr:MAG: prepilin peptidase [Patescibacteria group bacterium]
MIDVALPIFIFAMGASVGSFINVVTLRFGFSEKVRNRSHCMACDIPIASHDLIPIFSFFFLGGRCRHCKSKLTLQYPIVELLLGVLFLSLWYTMPPSLTFWSLVNFVSVLVFLSTLVALVVYDLKHTLVPLAFAYTLLVSGFVATSANAFRISSLNPIFDGLIGGAVLFAFFAGIVFVTRGKGMGMGDAYIAGAVGVLLGIWRGIEAVSFGVWIATALYLTLLLLSSLLKKTTLLPAPFRVTIRKELPFIPFIAIGVLISLFTNLSPLEFGSWIGTFLW